MAAGTRARKVLKRRSRVFVDDTAVNVEAATALGMHGVLVDPDPASALERIRALVGLS